MAVDVVKYRRVFTAEVAEVAEKNAEYSRDERRGGRQEVGRWIRYICKF
jgi:hypothetical protein